MEQDEDRRGERGRETRERQKGMSEMPGRWGVSQV